ncbi:glycosyltransferase family 2 protein [Sporolituus thermophilus]|uniref:Glycosyltransferase 2-like domain-containing protein n=1 Tax=Sporolituus thermophilus DSM 23256 TaxID=1123285 RepID=A0A1G7ND36_9FIRM|nr:glycosyltransferase family 2 protein [Sporolituus thermophilus]SDF71817.1 hypothetical protein SAMN05660235_02520 [Sporolituus thermophilus DSM 23256]
MASSAKVGIVTVTYNSELVIEGFMNSLLAQTHKNFVLYVIDNQSQDNTLNKLTQYSNLLNMVVFNNSKNVGVATGNNQGIKRALADGCSHVLLVNNDTEFNDNLIEVLLDYMSDNKCDITVPKMMYHDNPSLLWFAGGHLSAVRAYSSVHEGCDHIDQGQFDTPRRITYAPTCCMLIKADVFSVIGLMDEKYFIYYDDTDFCLRALRKNIQMHYVPTAVLTHKVSSLTGGKHSKFALRYLTRNKVYYIRKNIAFPMSYIFLILFLFKIFFDYLYERDDREIFEIKQRAFIEGFRMG